MTAVAVLARTIASQITDAQKFIWFILLLEDIFKRANGVKTLIVITEALGDISSQTNVPVRLLQIGATLEAIIGQAQGNIAVITTVTAVLKGIASRIEDVEGAPMLAWMILTLTSIISKAAGDVGIFENITKLLMNVICRINNITWLTEEISAALMLIINQAQNKPDILSVVTEAFEDSILLQTDTNRLAWLVSVLKNINIQVQNDVNKLRIIGVLIDTVNIRIEAIKLNNKIGTADINEEKGGFKPEQRNMY
jgi:predicted unusual protein kinase regulating ubiquinone biosynthesis (AarF/ABC1/UbiB family)